MNHVTGRLKAEQEAARALKLLTRMHEHGTILFTALEQAKIAIAVESAAGDEKETFHVALMDTKEFLDDMTRQQKGEVNGAGG